MRKLSNVYMEDLGYLANLDFIDYEKFRNKTFFISGVTGLIGGMLLNSLSYINDKYKLNLHVIGLVRNLEIAKEMFPNMSCVSFIRGELDDFVFPSCHIDYVVHAACPTSSKFFNNNPVELISLIYKGTERMLEIARETGSRFVFLSTMEVYGTPLNNDKIYENSPAMLDTMIARSSYPEAKRLAENLVASYASEYGVNGMVLRLTQTFGPGVKYSDSRVFAEFARAAIEKRDIVLATKGETCRNYLYVADAVSAIFTILQKGDSANAYNVANIDSYCSIYEMARLVSDEVAEGKINVVIHDNQSNDRGFAPILHMNLDSTKICKLGWRTSQGLKSMFFRMIEDFKYKF